MVYFEQPVMSDTKRSFNCGRAVLLVVATCLLAGCAGLLPKGATVTTSSFETFQAAHAAFERIEPYKTQASELKNFGFDTESIRNVRLIPYPDLVSRLAPNSSFPVADLDRGIRECIAAHRGCRAYEFHFANEKRNRTGNFFLDFLDFSRTTAITGWRFDALLVISDGMVLFKNFGGEPNNDRVEHQVNPLGPLQASGQALAGKIQ